MDRVFDNMSLDISAFAPNRPGVYAVYLVRDVSHPNLHQRLIYIGSSKNLKKRLQCPRHPYGNSLIRKRIGLTAYYVFCKFIECQNFKEMERELIRVYKPFLNKTLKGNGKKIHRQ